MKALLRTLLIGAALVLIATANVRAVRPVMAQFTPGQGGIIESVAYSPDGRLVASGSVDGSVRVWSVAARQATVTLHMASANVVAFSPDGALLAAAGDGGTIVLYETTAWQPAGTLVIGAQATYALAFNRDGRALASFSDGSDGPLAQLWDVPSQQQTAVIAKGTSGTGNGYGVAFSPDGSLVAYTTGDATVHLWDVALRRERAVLPSDAAASRSIAFSSDGRTLAVGYDSGAVSLWDVASRSVAGQLQAGARDGDDHIESVAFSPDGRTLAVGKREPEDAITVWDVAGRTLSYTLTGHEEGVTSLAFSPDGRSLASGSFDSTVRLWDLTTRSQATRLGQVRVEIRELAFSPGGLLLASLNNGGYVHLFNVAAQDETIVLSGSDHSGGLAFSPDGRLVASGGIIWDAGTGLRHGPLERLLLGNPSGVRFSPDGRTIVASVGQDVWLWDVASGRWLRNFTTGEQTDYIHTLAFSPDGAILAGANLGRGGDPPEQPLIVLWNVATGAQIATLRLAGGATPYDDVIGMSFSPDGRRLVTANGAAAPEVWDVGARQAFISLPNDAEPIKAVAFSPSGRLIAGTGSRGLVRFWDAGTYQPVADLQLPAGFGTAIAFSPDGNTLAVSEDDGVIQLYDVPQ